MKKNNAEANTNKAHVNKNTGQAITETVLCLMFLIMLSFAVLEFSRIFAFKAALRIAAGEIASVVAQMMVPLEKAGAWRTSAAHVAPGCKPWKNSHCKMTNQFRNKFETAAEQELWGLAGGNDKNKIRRKSGSLTFLSTIIDTETKGDTGAIRVRLKGCYRPFARFDSPGDTPEKNIVFDSFKDESAPRNCFGQTQSIFGGSLEMLEFNVDVRVPMMDDLKLLRSIAENEAQKLPTVEKQPRREALETWKWFLEKVGEKNRSATNAVREGSLEKLNLVPNLSGIIP